jgi:hypothetical protein
MAVKDWELYEAGKKYNNAITCVNNANYYDLMDTLIDFFNGNQWRNLEVTGMRKPVINIVQKAVRFWVASVTASNTKIDLEPLEFAQSSQDGQLNAAEFATTEIANLFEKFKIDNRIRDALFKAGIMGDCAAHFWFDPAKKPYGGAFGNVRGEICFELVNGTNVFFGNANNPDVQSQPYIIISGRDLVKNLQDEAKRYRQAETDTVNEDNNTAFEAGFDADIEVQADGYGKATYILVYKKVTAQRQVADEFGQPAVDLMGQPVTEEYTTVTVSKCVQYAYIYEDIDTGLGVYPVSWLIWDRQENQYHGRPPCAEILETQIFINLMFAMIMLHLMMTAFPKAIYNGDVIEDWTNQVGQAIRVRGMQAGENIKNYAAYLEPGQMSGQIVAVIEMAYNYVKDALGLSDAALGEVDPEQASGVAILATAKQSTIPLENTKANLYEFVEDFGRILTDMMGTYYGQRPIVVDQDGAKTLQTFDFTQLKDIWLNVKVDVGTTSVWSDAARKQTITNLMSAGKIEFIDWLERMDDGDIPDRQGLIDKIKRSMTDKQLLYGQMAKFVDTLPPEVQAQLEQLRLKNPQEYEMQVKQLMGGASGGTVPGVQGPAAGQQVPA